MSKQIVSGQAYTLTETADLLHVSETTLLRKLAAQDEFIKKCNAVKVGREWRFLGENLLYALGSVSYQIPAPQNIDASIGGIATSL